jgi:PAS domain S-box-containing protein
VGQTDQARSASTSRTTQDQGLDDFWCVYDAHFEDIYAQIAAASLEHPAFAPIARGLAGVEVSVRAREYHDRLARAIEGDPSSRDAYLRQVAHAYAAAGIGFADWAMIDSVFADAMTPLLVAAYADAPERLAGALQAMRRFTQRTTVVLGTAYIEATVTAAAQRALQEQKELLASLGFERQRLRTLLQMAPAAIVLMRGSDHVVEFANDQLYDLVGAREVVGKRLLDAFPETATQGIVEILDRILATGEPFVEPAMRVDLVRSPGAPPETRFLNVVYQAVVEADGTRSGIFSHSVDVTESVTAEQRIRAQFMAMPVPTYAWQQVEQDGKKDFVLTDYNDAALKLTQGTIARFLGARATAFFGDEASNIVADLRTCLSEGRLLRREMTRKLRSSGETKELFVTYANVPPDIVLVHTEDMTERTKLEEQLRIAQKMEAIGRLAGGIAHDFNNILSVILGYTALLTDELEKDDPKRDDLLEISTAADRAAALTKQLLAMGRRQVLQPLTIDLAQTLRGLEKMIRWLLGDEIQLSLQLGAELGAGFVDPTQIDQVITNLVVNARDAMPTGGRLSIDVENVVLRDADAAACVIDVRPGRYVMLEVTDTGTGMDAATMAKIFEPFFTTKPLGKGTGLGLATVFGIVRQSNGGLRVASQPGKGTTFQVYLPRVEGDRVRLTSAAPSGRETVPRGTETILLVEDDDQVRALARTVLRRQGYNVLEAQNGGEALLICEQYEASIQLMVTDVVMPRMSGRDLAERLAPMCPQMKVLFMSGYTDDAVVRHGVLTTGLPFLQKPLTASNLARMVRQVLDGTRTRGPSTMAPGRSS